MNPKKAPVLCPASVLFDIMKADLELGICCDIIFTWNKKKHRFGVWGDDGNTYKNLHFYFDKQEYESFEALQNHAVLDGTPLVNFPEYILVKECDGCYPRSTPQLEEYYLNRK